MNDIERIYDPMEKAFWQGTSNEELLIPHCDGCNEPHWYPRPICPHCAGRRIYFKPSRGTGVIYSLTRLRQKGEATKTIAYIHLDEGVTLLSRIVDDHDETAAIGQRIEVAFVKQENGPSLPAFSVVRS